MLLLRRVATGIVITAALAVVVLSVYLLWNVAFHPSYTSDPSAQQLEAYSRRMTDMQSLLIILLGISGLYIIVFILTTGYHTSSMRRRVDRTLETIGRQMDDSMRALRELKEEISNAIRAEAKDAADRLEDVRRMPGLHDTTPDLRSIEDRIATLTSGAPSDEQVQEIAHHETALPALELLYAVQSGPQLARIYRTLASYYRRRDPARSHFYLSHVQAMTPEDFETANKLANLALDRQPPDYRLARKYFEASLAARPDQQCAKYGLTRMALGEGDLETAIGLMESAVESRNWETSPDPEQAALVRYTFACALARRAQSVATADQSQYLLRATEELKAAFSHPTRQLEQMLSRDIEEGGDLFALANTPPYENAINELLLNVCVGAR